MVISAFLYFLTLFKHLWLCPGFKNNNNNIIIYEETIICFRRNSVRKFPWHGSMMSAILAALYAFSAGFNISNQINFDLQFSN